MAKDLTSRVSVVNVRWAIDGVPWIPVGVASDEEEMGDGGKGGELNRL